MSGVPEVAAVDRRTVWGVNHPTRERVLPNPCPTCDGEVRVVEVGRLLGDLETPVAWEAVRRYCTSGHPLPDEPVGRA